MFKPKLFSVIKDYNGKKFVADLTAGTIVGIVALPLAIAFAIASGVGPDKGLITAVIAGFIISAFGGSKVQIGGPTGAFIVIVFGIIQQYGVDGLIIATIIAGILLVIMGLAKIGSAIKFIPYPVVVGFTGGIALIIFSTQIKDLLGLPIAKVPSEFFEKWISYAYAIGNINIYAAAIGLGSIAFIITWQKFFQKVPGSLIAIILGTVAVQYFGLPVDTIGTKFGEIPSSLPMPVFPHITFETIKNLIQPAITIALLAGIESLLSAVVADGMTGDKHRSNTELIAQGIANIITPFFGGIPATGAIARTATNIKNGAKTPIAGMIHAIVLLLIMLFFGKYAKLIPLPSLAAILVIVSYNMSEWRSFVTISKSVRSDVAVLFTTFGLTVIFDLTIAIEIGMIMAVFLFMRKMSLVANVGVITREFEEGEEVIDPNSIDNKTIPHGVVVYEVNGPFFFGAVNKFKDAIIEDRKKTKIKILRMRNVPAIDTTGIHVLEETLHECKKDGIELLLSGVHIKPYTEMEKAGFITKIGDDNVLGNIDDALDRAREILGLDSLGRPLDFVPTVQRDIK